MLECIRPTARRAARFRIFAELHGPKAKPILGGGKATATPPFSRPHPFIRRNAAGQYRALGAWAGGGSFGMRLQRERAFERVFPGASPAALPPSTMARGFQPSKCERFAGFAEYILSLDPVPRPRAHLGADANCEM